MSSKLDQFLTMKKRLHDSLFLAKIRDKGIPILTEIIDWLRYL